MYVYVHTNKCIHVSTRKWEIVYMYTMVCMHVCEHVRTVCMYLLMYVRMCKSTRKMGDCLHV